MPKNTTQFVCSECGYTSAKWLGRCPDCGKFNTLVEEPVAPAPSAKKQSAVRPALSRAVPLSRVAFEKYERVSSGIAELDVVLGGGIVRGSLVLVGGDPGVGKSTLLTQVAAHLSKEHKVLYLSAEESCSQVKLRCERLKIDADDLMLLNETNLENAEEAILDAEYVIVDSIQAIYTDTLSSAAGSVGQVRECAAKLMRIAKSRGITFFIVGHVTKEGTLAGPKVLEHIMDAVLYFEGERTEKLQDPARRQKPLRLGAGSGRLRDDGRGHLRTLRLFLPLSLGQPRRGRGRRRHAQRNGQPLHDGRDPDAHVQDGLRPAAQNVPRRRFQPPRGAHRRPRKAVRPPLGMQDVYLNAMGGIKLNEPSADLAVCAE